MSNNTPAAQAAQDAIEWATTPGAVENFPATARAHINGLASLLLSKLRAPVADERAAFDPEVLAERLRDVAASHFETAMGFGISRYNFERCATDAAKIAQDMAIAPVAGEAVRKAPTEAQYKEAAAIARGFGARQIADVLDPPQASEAVCDMQDADEIDRLKGVLLGIRHRIGQHELFTAINEIDAALSAQPGAQKYWLCCGSKDPNHPNRRAPDCFHPDRAKWGTADQHSAAQKNGGSDAE